jgi:hypothetical protein
MTKSTIKPEELDETTVEAEDLATHQENIPVPYLGGTRRIAVRWLDEALDMVTEQAPDSAPQKK